MADNKKNNKSLSKSENTEAENNEEITVRHQEKKTDAEWLEFMGELDYNPATSSLAHTQIGMYSRPKD